MVITLSSGTGILTKFDDGTSTPGPGWNAKGQLRHLRYEKSGNLVRRFEYDYDNSGNRVSLLNVIPSKSLCQQFHKINAVDDGLKEVFSLRC